MAMRLIPFLLLPFTALSQSIEFFSGAGINPRHVESIGNEAGWVELCTGPMPTGGQIFWIHLDEWVGIDTIFVKTFHKSGIQSAQIIPRNTNKANQWFGVKGFEGWVRLEYTVKRKRA